MNLGVVIGIPVAVVIVILILIAIPTVIVIAVRNFYFGSKPGKSSTPEG